MTDMSREICLLSTNQNYKKAFAQIIDKKKYLLTTFETLKSLLVSIKSNCHNKVVIIYDMQCIDCIILKIQELSRTIPIIVLAEKPSIDEAVRLVKCGAVDYLASSISIEELLKKIDSISTITQNNGSMVAKDRKSLDLIAAVKNIAPTNVPCLITGSSGTGKEVLAKLIHDNSDRASKPFIAVNCAALPDTMLESLLFGHEKGSFTGALQTYVGKFEQANFGTLLLDEITEIPINMQAKLLRVLQESEVEKLGGKKSTKIDVRIIATSNRDIKKSVEQGVFREDLYYRLNVMELNLANLSDRSDDILPLAEFFIKKYAKSEVVLSESAIQVLLSYNWPGNIRELENTIRRSLLFNVKNKLNTIYLDNTNFYQRPSSKSYSLLGISSYEKALEDCDLTFKQYRKYMQDIHKLGDYVSRVIV